MAQSNHPTMESLLAAVRNCRVCAAHLPLGPRPVLQAAETSRILIVGQAPGVRVPQLGWNHVAPQAGCSLLREGYAYFANSFRLAAPPAGFAAAISHHGGPFVAAFERGPVLACQFHPELSGAWGIDLLRRWVAAATGATTGAPTAKEAPC